MSASTRGFLNSLDKNGFRKSPANAVFALAKIPILAVGITALCSAPAAAAQDRIVAPMSQALAESKGAPEAARLSASVDFPEGTATPSEVCGACHQTIYREFSEGFGGDLHWAPMKGFPDSATERTLPKEFSTSATAHSVAGVDPWPHEAKGVEEHGRQCDVCHYPQPLEYPDTNAPRVEKPSPRPANREAGVTCASCHLTPDGKIRGPYDVEAPHATVKDERMRTAAACAFCHSEGERVIGKQTQTFLEWRDDFHTPGLGAQHCQDCHMPKTVRKLAEDFDVPDRPVARHLWTGGHSLQRIGSALSLAITQPEQGRPEFALHVVNVGAGHSVPTGSNRRAIALNADVVDAAGKIIASKEWLFAPWFGARPDDRAFLEADKIGPEPLAATQADAQGPHETIIRAGEDRVLGWRPDLGPGEYTLRAALIYDLNRYNDRTFKDDEREIARTSRKISISSSHAEHRASD